MAGSAGAGALTAAAGKEAQMGDNPEFLRRKIEVLLDHLRSGVDAGEAESCLREIAEAEWELHAAAPPSLRAAKREITP